MKSLVLAFLLFGQVPETVSVTDVGPKTLPLNWPIRVDNVNLGPDLHQTMQYWFDVVVTASDKEAIRNTKAKQEVFAITGYYDGKTWMYLIKNGKYPNSTKVNQWIAMSEMVKFWAGDIDFTVDKFGTFAANTAIPSWIAKYPYCQIYSNHFSYSDGPGAVGTKGTIKIVNMVAFRVSVDFPDKKAVNAVFSI